MTPADLILTRWASFLHPREVRNIWQWADENRWFERRTTAKAMHGRVRYSSADAPHQRGVMESCTDPTVQTTVMLGASQIFGKTEILNCIMGYCMEYEPRDIIMLRPTEDSSKKFSKKKFMPMVRATPCLDALVTNNRSRDSGNTILVKEYTGGSIFFISANSTASLRGATGDVLLADEIDDNPLSAGEEGDPISLLFKRGESFTGGIQVLSSTPTILGTSAIWNWWEQSDQCLWYVPCPHCSTWGVFKWSPKSLIKAGPSFYFEYKPDKLKEACMVCASCGKALSDQQRVDAYLSGEWRATQPFSGIRGYQMNGLYCHWPAKKGWTSRPHQWASEWEAARKKGKDSLKVIVNTLLTEPWKVQIEQIPEYDGLMARREDYGCLVPSGVCYLTCGTDTQSNRLEYEVCGWGPGEECWSIVTGKLWGNPHTPEPWGKLDVILNQSWPHPTGAALRISCALIDSGGQNDTEAFNQPVYDYVLRKQGRHIFACKGSSELAAPLVVGRPQKNGIILQMVGTDVCKSTIYERLSLSAKGPGFCHFPITDDYTKEYFRQLTSEGVTVENGKRKWVKLRERNEALDMRVYNYAALEIRNVNLEAVSRAIVPKPPEAKAKPRLGTMKMKWP